MCSLFMYLCSCSSMEAIRPNYNRASWAPFPMRKAVPLTVVGGAMEGSDGAMPTYGGGKEPSPPSWVQTLV